MHSTHYTVNQAEVRRREETLAKQEATVEARSPPGGPTWGSSPSPPPCWQDLKQQLEAQTKQTEEERKQKNKYVVVFQKQLADARTKEEDQKSTWNEEARKVPPPGAISYMINSAAGSAAVPTLPPSQAASARETLLGEAKDMMEAKAQEATPVAGHLMHRTSMRGSVESSG
jgi:hypothetical protein